MVDRMRGGRSAGRPVAAALAALVLAASQSPARACPPGARGEAGDRLRVGYAPLAPFVLRPGPDGEVGGFSMDLLRASAERAGWTLELIELAPDTLHRRVAECQIDVGVVGVPVSAGLAHDIDLSQTYLVSATTVAVHAADLARAGASAGESRGGRIAHAGLHGLLWALVALAMLGLSSWLLNLASRRRGRLGLRWRRADPTVSGPLGGLRWLGRSTTGRVLASLWIAAGLVFGITGRTVGAVKPLHLGGDPLRELVERAAHTENLIGERMPDGQQVTCSPDGAAACFRAFEDGALVAVAGPREVLCSHLLDVGLDDVVMRDDLAVSERYAFLLPSDSPLRLALNRAILQVQQERRVHPPIVSCPGGPR